MATNDGCEAPVTRNSVNLNTAIVGVIAVAAVIGTEIAMPDPARARDRISISDFTAGAGEVDSHGRDDSSWALAAAVSAVNKAAGDGKQLCVYVPAGVYRIVTAPPSFVGAGCVMGEGPTQSIIELDATFQGDLFSWSEAWVQTTPGPQVVGISVRGNKASTSQQNAFVFYDRNDEVFIDNVDVTNVHGRALYSGAIRRSTQAYMRESHLRSLRFFGDGAPGVAVVEFDSHGSGHTDATNEIRISQMDIYGARGPGLVIRNQGSGTIRNITIDALRVEGPESGKAEGDLLTIGDAAMKGNVNNIKLTNLELIDPPKDHAALRMIAPPGTDSPYQIYAEGSIGGGAPFGQGLRIDAGRNSEFHLHGIYTLGTNVVIGRGVSSIMLEGGGEESAWTYQIDPMSKNAIRIPVLRRLDVGSDSHAAIN